MTTEIGVTESCGNVFLDLGFPSNVAIILALRADLMADLCLLVRDQGWALMETAQQIIRLKINGIIEQEASA